MVVGWEDFTSTSIMTSMQSSLSLTYQIKKDLKRPELNWKYYYLRMHLRMLLFWYSPTKAIDRLWNPKRWHKRWGFRIWKGEIGEFRLAVRWKEAGYSKDFNGYAMLSPKRNDAYSRFTSNILIGCQGLPKLQMCINISCTCQIIIFKKNLLYFKNFLVRL